MRASGLVPGLAIKPQVE